MDGKQIAAIAINEKFTNKELYGKSISIAGRGITTSDCKPTPASKVPSEFLMKIKQKIVQPKGDQIAMCVGKPFPIDRTLQASVGTQKTCPGDSGGKTILYSNTIFSTYYWNIFIHFRTNINSYH